MEAFRDGDLQIEVKSTPGALSLVWRGRSNAREPALKLNPFFETVADEARAQSASVEIRLNELEYLNSSTLSAIIRAIGRFREQKTKVLISYLQSSGWQRRSCDALRVLESDGALEVRGE